MTTRGALALICAAMWLALPVACGSRSDLGELATQLDAGASLTGGTGGAGGSSASTGGSGTSTGGSGTTSTGGGGASTGSGTAGSGGAGGCDPAACVGGCVIEGATARYQVAVDSTHAYWTYEWKGGVKRVPICGGPVTTLSTEGTNAFALALDATHVYWVDLQGLVYRAPIGGGATDLLLAFSAQPQAIALDDTDVYVTTVMGMDSGLWRISKDGSAVTKLEDGTMKLGLAVDATSIYYYANGAVMRRAKSAGPPVPIASLLVEGPMVVDGDRLYFSTWIGTGRLFSIGKDGSTPLTLAVAPGPIRGLAVDATHVYWTREQGGTVLRTPKMGGESETIASNQDAPVGLALNEPWVVWVDYLAGTLNRAPH